MDAHQRTRKQRLGVGLAGLALVVALHPCLAQPTPAVVVETTPLREVQVAVLYHLLQYVEGLPVESAPSSTPFEVAVLGLDPFGSILDKMTQLGAGGRAIVVRRGLSLEEFEHSDVIFVADSERDRLDAILLHFAALPKLLVSDIDGFAQLGGMVGLGITEGRLAIRLNRGAARRVGLDFDVELLRLADEVLR